MSLIIGVDGGGTKSTYKIFDTKTSKTHEYIGKSINFYSIGNETACESFSKVIDQIISEFNSDIISICIGSAALSTDSEIDSNHPFKLCAECYCKNVTLVSDLYIGLKGISQKPSIFLISGTGSMGVALTRDETMYTIGGWGYLLGDQGSGYEIGLIGIKEAIKSHDRISIESSLTQRMLQHFKLDNITDAIEYFYTKKQENKVIASFATEVHKASLDNDTLAIQILENATDYLAKCVDILHTKLNSEKTSLAVYGGNFEKSQLFYDMFKQKVLSQNSNIEIGFPDYIPVDSALIIAANNINYDVIPIPTQTATF
jgi:N-acetylglucosamine kinase-like BadF-type ATPase